MSKLFKCLDFKYLVDFVNAKGTVDASDKSVSMYHKSAYDTRKHLLP